MSAMLDKLGLTRRAEGEAALPDVGDLIERTKECRRTRIIAEREAEDARTWEEYKARCERERLEDKDDPDFVARLDAAAAKLGMDRKPNVIDTTPITMLCPHCSQELPVAPNIRFWTVQELRAYADVLERNQAIAAANREAEMQRNAVLAEGAM